LTNISVIIPALNEAGQIEGAVQSALKNSGGLEVEVIVADGTSADETARIAQKTGALVVSTEASRGLQMNHGATRASGDILIFLHADTRLPANWARAVVEALKKPGISGGAFSLSIDDAGWRLRVVERLSLFRARYLGLIYGDQAIFTTRETFNEIGGFKNLPLFEELDYVMKLRRKGRVIVLTDSVVTSARRWVNSGIVSNTLRNWFLLCLYKLGFNPRSLYRWYYSGKEKR
jgi:rSAM/selenodomain-associated transferase 2